MSEAVQTAQIEFPPIFVEYAKQKLSTEKELIEYLARFGHPFLKGVALMILAAGENAKNPAKAPEQQQETCGRK